VVHGSHEHKTLLQKARDHHERRREEMQTSIGNDPLTEWEELKGQTEEVERMMERVSD
jgi:hypothetical protein